ncbi:MAG: aminoacyl-tRNA hydrolase [Cyanobacteria bacterium SBLK]|nr:aminoacyl-tRNA hydrolase [Cyanobacteria bacterium SBLK]
MSTIPQFLVGLGNPGTKYEKTRHNIGFDLLDRLAELWQISWQENRRFKGYFTEGRAAGNQKIYLLKPTTYMNRSGESIRAVMDWYKLEPESLLVVYDDMDLAVGRLRIRLSGSAGGHNGIKSAIAHVGGQNFPRLRIGIGKTNLDRETVSHVLGKFTPEEKPIVSEAMELAISAIEMGLKEGLEKAMSLYNGRSVDL